MAVSFDVTKPEMDVIMRIVGRAADELPQIDRMTLSMDLAAVHANGNPLQLNALLIAKPFDFAHDIRGIQRHIDRETGRLGDFFSPRFSVR